MFSLPASRRTPVPEALAHVRWRRRTPERGAYSALSSSGGLSLQDTNSSDLINEADAPLPLRPGRSASGLAFRASRPGTGTEHFHGYYADLTAKGLVLGEATGEERTPLATARPAGAVGRTHRARIEAVGPSLKVYVDGMAEPKSSTTDWAIASGANGPHTIPLPPKAGAAAAPGKPSARFDNVSIRANVFSFEASDAPNRFIRHAGSRGRFDHDVTPHPDMRWKVVPGLADPSAASLESVDFPGTFLRQRDGEVWIDTRTDDADFHEDATWRRVPVRQIRRPAPLGVRPTPDGDGVFPPGSRLRQARAAHTREPVLGLVIGAETGVAVEAVREAEEGHRFPDPADGRLPPLGRTGRQVREGRPSPSQRRLVKKGRAAPGPRPAPHGGRVAGRPSWCPEEEVVTRHGDAAGRCTGGRAAGSLVFIHFAAQHAHRAES